MGIAQSKRVDLFAEPALERKALLIGIQYTSNPDPNARLTGCHDDVTVIKDFLIEAGWSAENIRVLRDLPGDIQPTKDNFLEGIKWLAEEATEKHALFFYYAGHGTQLLDDNGDEDDGLDEAYVPIDCEFEAVLKGTRIVSINQRAVMVPDISIKATEHYIRDDVLREEMLEVLPPGCRVRALLDMCHSATALDLPIMATADSIPKKHRLMVDAMMPTQLKAELAAKRIACKSNDSRLRAVKPSFLSLAIRRIAHQLLRRIRRHKKSEHPRGKDLDFVPPATGQATKKQPPIKADVISLSACSDAQNSDDSNSLAKIVSAVYRNYGGILTHAELLLYAHHSLRQWRQTPHLCSSHEVDWGKRVSL